MTVAQTIAFIDRIYADKRREALTRLLSPGGVPDIDIIDETIAAFDAEFEETRERLVAFLIEGGASDASRSDRL